MPTVGHRQPRPIINAAAASRLVEGVRSNAEIRRLPKNAETIAVARRKDIAESRILERTLAAFPADPEMP